MASLVTSNEVVLENKVKNISANQRSERICWIFNCSVISSPELLQVKSADLPEIFLYMFPRSAVVFQSN
jgi:hypothetical protein